MIIVLPKEVDDKFIKQYIPRILITKAFSKLQKYKLVKMSEYLKTFGIKYKIEDIIVYILKNLDINRGKHYCTLSINTKLKIDDYNLIQICKLIDFGNMEVKGLNIVNDAFDYVNCSKDRLIENYLMGL